MKEWYPHQNSIMKQTRKLTRILLAMIMFLILGCFGTEIEPLTLERIENNSSLLKLEGYYFNIFGDMSENIEIFFLYQNGVFLDGASSEISKLNQRELDFKSGAYANIAGERQSRWGVYKIENDQFVYEKWYAGNSCCITAIKTGLIKSDSVLVIDGREFLFKPFSPKPDSTNTFIN